MFFSNVLTGTAFDQEGGIRERRDENRRQVDQWTESMRSAAREDEALLLLPGLLADKRERKVVLWAETTGVKAGEAVEFVLISQRSGHDYEALAVSFAEPSAVHEALRFIGMQPGIPVDKSGLRFWPRGERVHVTFARQHQNGSGDALAPEIVDVETLLYDRNAGKPLPVQGFVFTGSHEREHPQTGQKVYAADLFGPNAIISTYNEPFTVMDVPRLAAQSDVYGSIVPNPEILLPADTLVKVELTPEYPPGRQRVFCGRLYITAGGRTPPSSVEDLRFSMESSHAGDPAPALTNQSVTALLAWMGRMTEDGRDPFVTLCADAELPWGVLRDFYELLQEVESPEGIRIEPPVEERLYYRAFLPAPWFRDRDRRTAHPDELFLCGAADDQDRQLAVWKRFAEEWPDETSPEPLLHVLAEEIAGPRELLEQQRKLEYRPQPSVLLVFAPPDLTLATLKKWMLPLRTAYPTQYVFETD